MKKREKIVIAICLIILCVIGFLFIRVSSRYEAGRAAYRRLSQMAGMEDTNAAGAERPELLKTDHLMMSVNPDYRAWIQIDGTVINYPVVREQGDDYYVTHTFDGMENPSGSIFMDANCRLFESGNTILYGHNMKDGSMFGALKSYLNSRFYQSHEWIQLYADGNPYQFRVFACVVAKDADSAAYTYDFSTMEEKLNFITQMKKNSVVGSDYVPDGTDTILTLSTCYGSGGRDRLLLLAAAPLEGGFQNEEAAP